VETTALFDWIKQSPPANPLEARITNLPIPLTSFIGRKRELSDVKEKIKSILGTARRIIQRNYFKPLTYEYKNSQWRTMQGPLAKEKKSKED
jgi:hypothetical protein